MESPFDVTNQIGPCGIACKTCFLGDGSIAKSAKQTIDYINMIGIKEWAPLVPKGADLNWDDTEKTLNWMTKYAYCAGCEKGGGPPHCAIRICAKDKAYELCNACNELDDCTKYDWLGEHGTTLKQQLKANIGKSKQELLKPAPK